MSKTITLKEIQDRLYKSPEINKLMTNATNNTFTNTPESNQIVNRIDALSATISRFGMIPQLGRDTFKGERDIYRTLGYPESISFEDYYNRYKRQGIATAIINKPVTATWSGELGITGTADTKDKKALSSLLLAWKRMENLLKVKKIKAKEKLMNTNYI
jgi:hypothetical protein